MKKIFAIAITSSLFCVYASNLYAGNPLQDVLKGVAKELNAKNENTSGAYSKMPYFAKAKVASEMTLYSSIATRETQTSDGIAPEGYPIGRKIGVLKPGDTVELMEMFPNDCESRYTLKVKTGRGTVGYILPWVDITEVIGDKGAMISVHLDRPYEFEEDIQGVDQMIGKYDEFIRNYPNSKYIPEALLNIVGLHLYTFQSDVDKRSRLDIIISILKQLSADTKCPANCRSATNDLNQYISKHQSELLNIKTNYEILQGAWDRQEALLLLVPSSLSQGRNEKN